MGHRSAVDHQLEARRFDERLESSRQPRGERREIGRLEGRPEPPRFDPREVQQIVDQPEETERVAMNGFQRRSAEHLRRVAQRLFERAQDQRERRAKLVADVVEEGRLGAVELGELLGPLPLPLVGAGARHGRGDLRRQQLEESPIGVVQGPPRADPEHEDAAVTGRPGAREREQHRLMGRLAPGLPGQTVEAHRQIFDQQRLPTRQDLPERPPGRLPAMDLSADIFHDRWTGGQARREPGVTGQTEVTTVGIAQVDEGERNVARVTTQDLRAAPGRFVAAARLCRHLPQELHPALTQDARRALRAGVEDPARPSGLIPDRAVGEGEVRLLEISRAHHRQQEILGPGGFTGLDDLLHHGADDVPDLRPTVPTAGSQKLRVLGGPQHGTVAVVVEHPALGPPPKNDGVPRVETDAHRRPQALRPALDRTERRLRPVGGADETRHLAAAREDSLRQRSTFRPRRGDSKPSCLAHARVVRSMSAGNPRPGRAKK